MLFLWGVEYLIRSPDVHVARPALTAVLWVVLIVAMVFNYRRTIRSLQQIINSALADVLNSDHKRHGNVVEIYCEKR